MDPQLRIGILTAALDGGGAERQAQIWARMLVSMGYRVTAMSLWIDANDPEWPGVEVIHLPKNTTADLAKITWRLRRMQDEFDAILVFEPYLAVCAMMAGLRKPWMLVTGKVPYVLNEDSRIPIGLIKRSFDKAAFVSAPNQAMVDAHLQMGIGTKTQWLVVPNVADSHAFVPGSAERAGALWLGRLEEVKNPVLAVEAAAAADVPLTLLGYGALEDAIEAAIAAHPDGPEIRLLPYREGPWSLYAGARVLLVSSRFESFGNVIVESLAAGTPVVSVDCDLGPREIITGAKYSLLVDATVEAIAAGLREVMARPYSAAEEAECREIASRYRFDAVEPLVGAAVEGLLASGSAPRPARRRSLAPKL